MDKKTERKLIDLLQYCKENIPYYIDLLKNVDLNRLENLGEIFSTIPIIHKDYLKNNWRKFVSTEFDINQFEPIFNIDKDFNKEYVYNVDGTQFVAECTSGNTGVPFVIVKTARERLILGRLIWKKRREYSSEVTPKNFINFVHQFGDNRYPFPFEFNYDSNIRIKKEINYLMNSDILMWHISGYKLNEYSSYLSDKQISFSKLKFIENNGSYLSETDRCKYEMLFNTKIANNYGCREVWNIAYSCLNNHLHVNNDSVYLEIVDENGNVITQKNKLGYIVVTSLNLKSFPFIRYFVGDMGKYSFTNCKNEGQVIEIFPGRDYIYDTKIYGNKIFKSVIISLITDYNLKNFDSISVKQVDKTKFIVNIKNNKEIKSNLEAAFKKTADTILTNNNIQMRYKYIFTYNNNLRVKSIFTCCV